MVKCEKRSPMIVVCNDDFESSIEGYDNFYFNEFVAEVVGKYNNTLVRLRQYESAPSYVAVTVDGLEELLAHLKDTTEKKVKNPKKVKKNAVVAALDAQVEAPAKKKRGRPKKVVTEPEMVAVV